MESVRSYRRTNDARNLVFGHAVVALPVSNHLDGAFETLMIIRIDYFKGFSVRDWRLQDECVNRAIAIFSIMGVLHAVLRTLISITSQASQAGKLRRDVPGNQLNGQKGQSSLYQ